MTAQGEVLNTFMIKFPWFKNYLKKLPNFKLDICHLHTK